MKQREISEPTDQKSLVKANKNSSKALIDALFIGFLIGIIIFSIVNKSVGLFTLIPLYFIYKIYRKKSKKLNRE